MSHAFFIYLKTHPTVLKNLMTQKKEHGGETSMDKKQNKNNKESAEDLNLNQNREREIDLNSHREEFAEDLNFNRNQINHNREN
ncbi:hypothetical protein [Ureibacillus sinduriensis]|uniref:hypothetical protein n=2 Tax=Ureibacillus sinduriensis TaxID=561440 RepID=UPI001BFFF701|nr:hypothetical protein [Ureibacillus sinduriensis]